MARITLGAAEKALYKAARRGDPVAAVEALKQGADPRAPATLASLPPLHLSAKYGHVEVIEVLLKAGVPVDDPMPRMSEIYDIYIGSTALIFAADEGRVEAVVQLLAAGADPNAVAPNRSKYSPLHATLWWHLSRDRPKARIHCAEIILEHGGNPLAVSPRKNGEPPETPLSLARQFKLENLVTKMELALTGSAVSRQKAASAKAGLKGTVVVAPSLAKSSPKKEAFQAATRGDLAYFKERLRSGFDPNQSLRADGTTALLAAASAGKIELLKLFMKYGVDLKTATSYRRTALHLAVIGKHLGTVRFLLSQEADLNAPDRDGLFPLHLAAIHGTASMVSLLINGGADVNQRSVGRPVNSVHHQCTALHIAAYRAEKGVVRALLDNGADPNARDAARLTPLHSIISLSVAGLFKADKDNERTATAISEMLLSAGAQINARDQLGATPLHRACQLGRTKIVRLLLVHGADPNIPADDGTTTLQCFDDEDEVADMMASLGFAFTREEREALRKEKMRARNILREFGAK